MKRKVYIIVLTLLFMCLFSFRTHAYENPSSESISQLVEILPDSVRGELEEPIREDKVQKLLSVEFFIRAVISAFSSELGELGSVFCTLLALSMFFAVATLIKNETSSEGMGKIIDNALLIISALTVYSLFSSGLERVYSYIDDIKNFQNALVPVMTGLYLSGGNTATAVSANAGAGAALIVVENLCAHTLPLLVRISFALTLIGAVGADINYGIICKSVRNIYMTVLGFFTMILSVSIAFGTSLASSADTVAARTVKFAIGNMIPIVGSTVNSAYGTLAASLSLIKNTVGASSIVAILLITLPVIIYLLLLRIILNICASVSDILGCARIGKLYTDFRTVYDMALAATVFCSIIFIIIVSVFLKCVLAVG